MAGDDVPAELRDALLEHGPAMLDLVLALDAAAAGLGARLRRLLPRGAGRAGLAGAASSRCRSTGRVLGGELARLNRPYLPVPRGVAVTQADYRWLTLGPRHPRAILASAKVAGRLARSRLLGHRMLSLGQALAAGLRAGLLAQRRAGVAGYPADRPGPTDGRVTGVRVTRDGKPAVIRARRGVLIATGGFERNEQMRQPVPAGADRHRLDDRRGRQHRRRDRGRPAARRGDRPDGRRLVGAVDPAAPRAVLLPGRTEPARAASWSTARAGGSSTSRPRTSTRCTPCTRGTRRTTRTSPPGWSSTSATATGTSSRACRRAGRSPAAGTPRARCSAQRTSASSPRPIGVDPDGLAQTVARFNEFARTGRDEEFRRGDSAYDRYYGDPRVRPNPNLAPLASAPFYAAKIVPGDLGTKGGLRTDDRARVLRADGTPIPGLYAAGNASAAVMGHSYAGAGATIGPAMTFGYIAALDLTPDAP